MTHEELIEQVAQAIAKEHARMGRHYGSMAQAATDTIRTAVLAECQITGNQEILKWLMEASPLGEQSNANA